MIRINLLPVRLARKKENIRKQLSIYLLSVLFVILVVAYLRGSLAQQVKALTSETEQVQNETKKYNQIVRQIEEQKRQRDLLQKKLEVLDQLEKGKAGPVHLLDEICARLPGAKVWLKSLKQDEKRLLLEGIALDNETIAAYMRNLSASPCFASVDLINSAQEMVQGVKLMQFTIACETKAPPGEGLENEGSKKKV